METESLRDSVSAVSATRKPYRHERASRVVQVHPQSTNQQDTVSIISTEPTHTPSTTKEEEEEKATSTEVLIKTHSDNMSQAASPTNEEGPLTRALPKAP